MLEEGKRETEAKRKKEVELTEVEYWGAPVMVLCP